MQLTACVALVVLAIGVPAARSGAQSARAAQPQVSGLAVRALDGKERTIGEKRPARWARQVVRISLGRLN